MKMLEEGRKFCLCLFLQKKLIVKTAIGKERNYPVLIIVVISLTEIAQGEDFNACPLGHESYMLSTAVLVTVCRLAWHSGPAFEQL